MHDGHLSAERIDRFLEAAAGIDIRGHVSLTPFTSFHIGGPCRFFATVHGTGELSTVVGAAQACAIPVLFLGGGTNLLVSDTGYAGLVVKTTFDEIYIDPTNASVRVGAMVPSARLVDRLIGEGWGGLQFAAGLPGTVGGAVAGNAGCFGQQISDRLVCATVVEASGQVREIRDPGWFDFEYRNTHLLREGAYLVDATFSLEKVSPADLQTEADRYIAVRRQKHPAPEARTAGSFFKNLPPLEPGGPRRAAGALLDQVGAKSLRVGDAAVFERHANIVVNRGSATAADVLALTAEMKRRVRDQFGVVLEPEVHFIGEE